MKRTAFAFSLLLLNLNVVAQENDSLNSKLDLLRAPSSPAASLLSFAPNDIEKPSDVSSFMLSLVNSATNFSGLPSNYAVDIAPYWLLRSGSFTTDKLNSPSFSDIFKQTFVLSIGYKNPDSLEKNLNRNNAYTSFGFKFSIARGHYDSATQATLDAIGNIQSKVVKAFHDAALNFDDDPEYHRLKRTRDSLAKALRQDAPKSDLFQQVSAALVLRQTALNDSVLNALNALPGFKNDLRKLQSLAGNFKISRLGFFCNISGGTSLEFVGKAFNHSKVYNAGTWATFGNTSKKGWGTLGILRYLYHPQKIYADANNQLKRTDLSTFDAGGRLVFSNPQSRFSFGAEVIYRSVLNSEVIKPSWRFVTNAEYDLPNNQKLTFSFGRDFNGTITKDGTLIAALNFLTGFGNKR